MSDPLMHSKPDKNCTVYLVDDDRGMVSATSQWLTLSGLSVKAFADPKLILKAIKPNDFCVLVSDVRMPDLDGMGLMSLIHRKDRNIPVILITGHGDIPLAVEAMKAGAYQFLPKPFSPEELLKVVCEAQAVRQKSLQDHKSEVQAEANVKFDEVSLTENDQSNDGKLGDKVDEYEKTLIEAALKRNKGNISDTLDELDIPRRTLNAKMKKYGISRKEFRAS